MLAPVVLLLAWANGANDNFKGTATLYGSGSMGYRPALALATVATFLGSMAALHLAHGLVEAFSGKGLVPEAVAADPRFLTAVSLGAGLTVAVSTWLGLPVSTTHALIGALLGAGLVEVGTAVSFVRLGSSFVTPLLLSPLLSAGLACGQYLVFRRARRAFGIEAESCVCLGADPVQIGSGGDAAALVISSPRIVVGTAATCANHYSGTFLGIEVGTILDRGHILSAAAVSFARGLNDTPKIAALILAARLVAPGQGLMMVAAVIALGGLFGARRVAETMSRRITDMGPGEAFAGNLATALLVGFASWLALPVSTTHVACGALFGIGAVSGRARWHTIGQIATAWLATLPLAAVFAALSATLLVR